jgi:hypothetical protein
MDLRLHLTVDSTASRLAFDEAERAPHMGRPLSRAALGSSHFELRDMCGRVPRYVPNSAILTRYNLR